MNVLLYLGIFWTLYGLAGLLGWQRINNKYKGYDWTKKYTFATMALQNGVDVKTVSSMLGHYSAGFTLDTYAHVTTDAQLKAAQTMGNILSRAV